MTEEKKKTTEETKEIKPEIKKEVKPEEKKEGDVKKKSANKRKFVSKKKFSRKNGRPDSEYDQSIIDIARVTRVMAGGKRMRFRACVAVGNKKGKIGVGLAKGKDVTIAITKAANQAKKNMIDVQLANNTIPHAVTQKYGAGLVLLKPAKEGRGIICGGVVRLVVELAGIQNVTGKILGTNNKVTNAKTVIKALESLKPVKQKKIKKKVKIEKKEEAKPENK